MGLFRADLICMDTRLEGRGLLTWVSFVGRVGVVIRGGEDRISSLVIVADQTVPGH